MMPSVEGIISFLLEFATHSPIFMAYPHATLLLMEQTIREVAYEKTEHYTVMHDFFNHREAMLRELLA